MKLWINYLTFFGLGSVGYFVLLSMAKSPETSLEGQWTEVAWEYEKVDKNDSLNGHYKNIASYVKNTIGENLIIHKAERWHFYPNGKLVLEGNGFSEEVTWCIKGRGNLLELKYAKNSSEHYIVSELSEDSLVLNFDTDVHTRGIARLTFKKTN